MRSHANAPSVGSTQRRAVRIASTLGLGLALLALSAVPAGASKALVFNPQTFGAIAQPSFGSPSGMAVDQSTGDLLVIDSAAGTVSRYSADGTAASFSGLGTNVINGKGTGNCATVPADCDQTPQNGLSFALPLEVQLAVDGSGGASDGNIYVTQSGNALVDVFGSDGKYLGQLTKAGAAGFGEACGVAVDPSGNVYVGDYNNGVHKFDPSGSLPLNADHVATFTAVSEPCNVAAGAGPSAGSIFVVQWGSTVTKLDSSTGAPKGVVSTGSNTTASVDPVSGHLYVAKGTTLSEYDVSGASASLASSITAAGEINGLAVRGQSGDVYLDRSGSAKAEVFHLLSPPEALTGDATAISLKAATLNATVNPAGVALEECSFEYGTTSSYGQSAPCVESPAAIGAGESPVAVHADLSGLAEGTIYHFRLSVKSAYFTVKGGDATFITAGPPLVHGESASQIHDTSAKLEAQVNPARLPTSYHFEYVTEAEFDEGGYAKAISAPAGGQGIGSGAKDVSVAQQVEDLTPATAYRFRIEATNSSGTVAGPGGTFTTYSSPQGFDLCPNEELRAFGAHLPDCRAYEQASPIDKNGGNVQGALYSAKASIDGDAVSFESAAGIPGGAGSQEFPTYLARRGADDWSTQGLLPPASAGEDGRVLGWTPDFAQVFDLAGTGATIGYFFVSRSSADGSFTTIAPYTPSQGYSYIGASSDGSTVLFTASKELSLPLGSPTPAAGKTNLYAWDRDAGELSLAGILPDGSTPASGSDVGNGYIQDRHTVASDGSAYFSAGGQLYLRQHPTEPETALKDAKGNCVPDPVLACTIRVSASQKDNGTGLEGHDAAGTRAASFLGASTDGSKSFFTSSEKLTNDANTGVEPVPPAIARANIADGSGVDLSFLPAFAKGIVIAGEYVYWTNPEAGTIGRAKKADGGEFDEDLIVGLDKPEDVAVDAEHVYWTDNAGEEKAGEGSIGRSKLNGGGVEDLETAFIPGKVETSPGVFETLVNKPRGIAVDAGHVYWINAGSEKLARANIDGSGANPEFAFGASGDVAVNGSKVYFTRSFLNEGFIRTVNLDGSENENILTVTGASKSLELALDGSHLYWTNPDKSTIGRSNLDGSGAEQELVKDAATPQGLAVSVTHIYWTANQGALPNPGNDLYRYDAETDELIDLAVDGAALNGAEVLGLLGTSADGSYAYFAANGVPSGVANSPNGQGESALPGTCKVTEIGKPGQSATGICNLYLWHDDGTLDGDLAFVARLDASGIQGQGDSANWISSDSEALGGGNQKTARVSADGLTLLLRSQRQLTAYDNEGTPQLYRYRVGDPGLICISCNPTGVPPALTDYLMLGAIRPPTFLASARGAASILSRNLSADGNRVFFDTHETLVAADTNGDAACPPWGSVQQAELVRACRDAYMWEANGTGSCESEAQNGGCLYLLSTGKGSDASFFIDASADGEDAFIFTYSQLVGQDQDNLADVYDVSVGGGLASQNEVPPVPCEGEGCKAGAKEPPTPESAGSAGLEAPGNPPIARKPQGCPKGKRKVRAKGKVRCVPRHKRQNRKANKTRRASR